MQDLLYYCILEAGPALPDVCGRVCYTKGRKCLNHIVSKFFCLMATYPLFHQPTRNLRSSPPIPLSQTSHRAGERVGTSFIFPWQPKRGMYENQLWLANCLSVLPGKRVDVCVSLRSGLDVCDVVRNVPPHPAFTISASICSACNNCLG